MRNLLLYLGTFYRVTKKRKSEESVGKVGTPNFFVFLRIGLVFLHPFFLRMLVLLMYYTIAYFFFLIVKTFFIPWKNYHNFITRMQIR